MVFSSTNSPADRPQHATNELQQANKTPQKKHTTKSEHSCAEHSKQDIKHPFLSCSSPPPGHSAHLQELSLWRSESRFLSRLLHVLREDPDASGCAIDLAAQGLELVDVQNQKARRKMRFHAAETMPCTGRSPSPGAPSRPAPPEGTARLPFLAETKK